MSSTNIQGSGSAYYAAMGADGYRRRINTPADSSEYFDSFHRPMLERARERLGDDQITVLDIACGPAMELRFLDEYPHDKNIALIATDISPAILPSVVSRYRGKVAVFASDVRNSPIRREVADVTLLVNAMIYSPGDMLRTATDALKQGGELAVNFRDYNNPNNAAFYDYYLERKGRLLDRVVNIQGVGVLAVKVLDYRECVDDNAKPDLAIRQLGQQMYFTSPDDIMSVATSTGLQVVSRAPFRFQSPANPLNEVDVFVLQKTAEPSLIGSL